MFVVHDNSDWMKTTTTNVRKYKMKKQILQTFVFPVHLDDGDDERTKRRRARVKPQTLLNRLPERAIVHLGEGAKP